MHVPVHMHYNCNPENTSLKESALTGFAEAGGLHGYWEGVSEDCSGCSAKLAVPQALHPDLLRLLGPHVGV